MATDSELRNLGDTLRVTLSMMQDAGINVLVAKMGIKNTYQGKSDTSSSVQMNISPMTICEKCNNWSPADQCLWCEPDFGGEGVA